MGSNKDQDQTTSRSTNRRGFLKMASVSAPATIVAVTASGGAAESAGEDVKTSGVQDTAHTRAYFASARF